MVRGRSQKTLDAPHHDPSARYGNLGSKKSAERRYTWMLIRGSDFFQTSRWSKGRPMNKATDQD